MKKLIALILALSMCLCLFAGCSEGTTNNNGTTGNDAGNNSTEGTGSGSSELAGTYDITVWVAEEIVELTQQQIADYNASNEHGITFNATVAPVGEGDAATSMTTDVEAGADIFCFAQDQTARLIQAGALTQLGAGASSFVTTNNDSASVSAVTSGEALYGYPLTSDNGYFMYYDKSVISEDDIDSLESLIAACEAAGRNFSFELENSWYTVSFFFATGCDSTWETDSDGTFIKVNDTFNSDKGLLACEGMSKLVTSNCYVNSSTTADFEAAVPSAVVVSGTWNYENAKSILGDNMGVADLPSFTAGGQTYHLGSYNGCKLMGVKPQTDAVRSAALNQLAQYLTSEKCQLERFEAKGWGPSNVAAQTNEAVASSEHLVALWAQNVYSVPQGQIHGSWWDIAKVIATSLKEGMEAQTALDNYVASMNALFEMTSDELTAWGVIGNICGTNWDADFLMTEQADGTFKSEALELHASEEFKVRQGKSWDVNYGADGVAGGDNIVVEADGTYYVLFDAATGMITLEAAE